MACPRLEITSTTSWKGGGIYAAVIIFPPLCGDERSKGLSRGYHKCSCQQGSQDKTTKNTYGNLKWSTRSSWSYQSGAKVHEYYCNHDSCTHQDQNRDRWLCKWNDVHESLAAKTEVHLSSSGWKRFQKAWCKEMYFHPQWLIKSSSTGRNLSKAWCGDNALPLETFCLGTISYNRESK